MTNETKEETKEERGSFMCISKLSSEDNLDRYKGLYNRLLIEWTNDQKRLQQKDERIKDLEMQNEVLKIGLNAFAKQSDHIKKEVDKLCSIYVPVANAHRKLGE